MGFISAAEIGFPGRVRFGQGPDNMAKQDFFKRSGKQGRDLVESSWVESLDSLPWGWRDRQAPGVYAVSRTADTGFFQYTCGPHSWKRYLYPPNMRFFSVSLEDGGIQLEQTGRPDLSYAFLGMRACDLKALAVLDRVLAEQGCPDPDYQALRRNLFIIAVNCLQPGGTCFCAAMGAGPRPVSGYDIVLHEICEPARYRLIAESGSPRGADLLSAVGCMPASMAAKVHVQLLSDAAAKKMKTTADLSDAGSLFGSRFDHPHWKTLEQRCLACGNCTLVCPTCFCHTVGETEFVEEGRAQRHRQWDSCFSKTFSYMHGGSIRTSIASRYRDIKAIIRADRGETPLPQGAGQRGDVQWRPFFNKSASIHFSKDSPKHCSRG